MSEGPQVASYNLVCRTWLPKISLVLHGHHWHHGLRRLRSVSIFPTKIYQNISKYIKIYIRMIFEDRVKDVKNIENKTAQLEQSTQLVSLRLKTKWQRHSCSLAGMGIRSILEEAKDGGNSFGSFSRLRKQPPSQVMLTSKDSTHEEILRSKRAVCWVLSFLSFPTAL